MGRSAVRGEEQYGDRRLGDTRFSDTTRALIVDRPRPG